MNKTNYNKSYSNYSDIENINTNLEKQQNYNKSAKNGIKIKFKITKNILDYLDKDSVKLKVFIEKLKYKVEILSVFNKDMNANLSQI